MSERKYAPRSGGRTAEQRSSTKAGARRYPTMGTAALKAEAAEPLRSRAATEAAEPLRGRAAGAVQPQREVGAREAAVTPRLRVAPPAPISAPRAPFIAVVIAIVVAGVIGILLINTKTNENAFKISKLQDQKAALDNQQQKLENQIAGYESTGNLDVAARRLGLVKADSPAYIRLPDGRVIGVPKPGTGPAAVTAQSPSGSNTAGGNTAGGNTAGSNTAGGNTAGGNTAGGNTAGGNTTGSNTAGTNAQDGDAQNGVIPAGDQSAG